MRALLLSLLAASWVSPSLAASDPRRPSGVAEVKAVFLFNFTKFVEWPPEAFADPASPLVIGVLGPDPFGPALDEAVAGEKADGRRVEVVRFKSLDELGPCHILFIAAAYEERAPELLRRLRRDATLTVSDIPGFTARGGVVQFLTEGGRVRFEISQAAAERAGLRVSARLLNLASVVRRRP